MAGREKSQRECRQCGRPMGTAMARRNGPPPLTKEPCDECQEYNARKQEEGDGCAAALAMMLLPLAGLVALLVGNWKWC